MVNGQKQRSNVKRLCSSITLAVLVCCALSCSDKTENALAEAEQRIRDAGQPVTLEELNAYYPAVPIDQNAAFVYGEAFVQFESVDPGGERTVGLLDRLTEIEGRPIPADLQTELSAHVRTCTKVFATLDRAATMPRARYSMELRRGFDVELPHLAHLRSIARLEVLRGALALSENRPDDFVRSQTSKLRLAGSIDHEPLIISQLVRIAVHGIAVDALERGLRRTPIPVSQLQALQDSYRLAENSDVMVHAYVGERCVMNDIWRKLTEDSPDPPDSMLAEMRAGLQQAGIDTADRDAIVRQRYVLLTGLEPLTELTGISWPERIRLGEQLEARIEQEHENDPTLQVLTPALVSAVEAFGRDIAMLRSAQTALAVERCRVDNGELPTDLTQLVPKYFTAPIEDPFDGQPLRYKRLTKGYQVYSVYADLEDNGGRQAERGDDGESNGDWVFEVRRRKRTREHVN
jgi:GAF domain-containing protein